MTTTKTTITFQELGLGAVILKALKENGFEAPFPIQKAAIPLLLKSVDVIGQAHTGTGKTAYIISLCRGRVQQVFKVLRSR